MTQNQKVNEVMIQHLEGELNGRTLERETNEEIGQNLREQADKVATRTEMYYPKVNKLEEEKKASTNRGKCEGGSKTAREKPDKNQLNGEQETGRKLELLENYFPF